MLYRLSIQDIENNKIIKLFSPDNYFFSHNIRLIEEDIESTRNIKNIIKEVSDDISNHRDKKASETYDKMNTKYLGYLNFDKIKESILLLRDSYNNALYDIDEICKLVDFSNNVKLDQHINENSKEKTLLSRQSGIYTLRIKFSNNIYNNVFDIYLEEDNANNKIITQFQRFASTIYQISIDSTGYFLINNNKRNIEFHNLPQGLSEKLGG